jgi:hypothetical protein
MAIAGLALSSVIEGFYRQHTHCDERVYWTEVERYAIYV